MRVKKGRIDYLMVVGGINGCDGGRGKGKKGSNDNVDESIKKKLRKTNN